MNQHLIVQPIGVIRVDQDGCRLELTPAYAKALTGLDDFSYLNILWWFSGCSHADDRRVLLEEKPYTHGPAVLGVFATRSPRRPNPIALSCAGVSYIDTARGVIGLAYIDADDQSPVLDIKPYTPSLDRVARPQPPAWCRHWPENIETSGDFDWEAEFSF